jgi:hypothetical protein
MSSYSSWEFESNRKFDIVMILWHANDMLIHHTLQKNTMWHIDYVLTSCHIMSSPLFYVMNIWKHGCSISQSLNYFGGLCF